MQIQLYRFFWAGAVLAGFVFLAGMSLAQTGAGNPLAETPATQPASSASARSSLRLRVSDVTGTPGGLTAIIVRTYASRGIRQGELCMDADWDEGGYGNLPFASLEGVAVFGTQNDVTYSAGFELVNNTQRMMVRFDSPSASINEVEGPLLAFFFRIHPTVEIGKVFGIEFDEAASFILDASGEPVELDLRYGTLTIRDPGAPYSLEAADEKLRPGELAELGVETLEPLPLSNGQFGIRYDPRIIRTPPRLAVDRRYGNVIFKVEDQIPGLTVISFVSPDSSYNLLPGDILQLVTHHSPRLIPDAKAALWLDPDLTYVVDWAGSRVLVNLVDGGLQLRRGSGKKPSN